MTLEAAVRRSLGEMTVPGVPREHRAYIAIARHVLVCSLCAETLRERVEHLVRPGDSE